jgi:hypothetical protein
MKHNILKNKLNWVIGVWVLWSFLGCESTYYKTMEEMEASIKEADAFIRSMEKG